MNGNSLLCHFMECVERSSDVELKDVGAFLPEVGNFGERAFSRGRDDFVAALQGLSCHLTTKTRAEHPLINYASLNIEIEERTMFR